MWIENFETLDCTRSLHELCEGRVHGCTPTGNHKGGGNAGKFLGVLDLIKPTCLRTCARADSCR